MISEKRHEGSDSVCESAPPDSGEEAVVPEDRKPARSWQWMFQLVGIVIFAAAVWVLHRELSNFNLTDFRNYLSSLTVWQLTFAVGATAVGYAALVGYDWFSLRYVGARLPLVKTAFTAFISYAFSLNIGQAALSGGAVRMRLYSEWGMGVGDISRVIGFNCLISLLGQFFIGGVLFTFFGIDLPENSPIPSQSVRWLGIIFLLGIAWFLGLLIWRRKPVRWRKWSVELPEPRLAFPAIIVSALDWGLTGVVLYSLLPVGSISDPSSFLGIVMLAHIASILSMVPGGLGVFETVVLHLLPDAIPHSSAISALIAFRTIYYLIPFLIAILLFGLHEAVNKRRAGILVVKRIVKWLSPPC